MCVSPVFFLRFVYLWSVPHYVEIASSRDCDAREIVVAEGKSFYLLPKVFPGFHRHCHAFCLVGNADGRPDQVRLLMGTVMLLDRLAIASSPLPAFVHSGRRLCLLCCHLAIG